MQARKAVLLAGICLLGAVGCKDSDQEAASDEPSFIGVDVGELRINSTLKAVDGKWTVKLYVRRSKNDTSLDAEDLDVALITSEGKKITADKKEPKSGALKEWSYKYWRSEMVFIFNSPDDKPKRITAIEIRYKKDTVKSVSK